MIVKIKIEQTIDLDDNGIIDEFMDGTDIDTKIDYLVNTFCESIDNLVKYDEVRNAVEVEYIEE